MKVEKVLDYAVSQLNSVIKNNAISIKESCDDDGNYCGFYEVKNKDGCYILVEDLKQILSEIERVRPKE